MESLTEIIGISLNKVGATVNYKAVERLETTPEQSRKGQQIMSFFESIGWRERQSAARSQAGVPAEPGCAQCGGRLPVDDYGRAGAGDKCFNCTIYDGDDDDEPHEELED